MAPGAFILQTGEVSVVIISIIPQSVSCNILVDKFSSDFNTVNMFSKYV